MPAVGMRRTTRVFGVVTGTDSARVLRSGRRLWPDAGEVKAKRAIKADEFTKNSEKGAEAPPRAAAKAKQETNIVTAVGANEIDSGIVETKKQGTVERGDKFFGIVYTRKRKRTGSDGDKKIFGHRFSRRRWRQQQRRNPCVLAAVVSGTLGSVESGLFSCFLFWVLSYARRTGFDMKELSAFVRSEPLYSAYASKGIQLLQDSPSASVGVCQFFRISQFMPSFSVDFSAVPLCFKYLHSAMILKSMFRSFFLVYILVNGPNDVEEEEDEEIDFPKLKIEQKSLPDTLMIEPAEIVATSPEVTEIGEGLSFHAQVKNSRLPVRNGQYRNLTKGIQRRRTSLRKRKARNPSLLDRSNGTFTYDLRNGRKRSISAVASNNKKLRSLTRSSSAVSLAEASCEVADSTGGDSSHCSANILVTESDKCYRVEGAVVTLEMSGSRDWQLAVKKDGLTRCTLKAEKVMRPCSSNRYTHVIMYSLDNGLKLEFPNRRDWSVFRDLYKECSERHIPGPVAKFIPVPGVCDVQGYADGNIAPFYRPDTYISANGDELSRAMARKTANYDMDSEDEEWLSKFNSDFQENVSEDNFELIVDALEKAYYCNPDDSFDEKSVGNQYQELGSKVVVEAVYNYWMRKRKQKRSLLLRVFQSHQAKKAPLIPKPLLRKRRSFKRQPSQFGRGKHPSFLQAYVAEQDALEEKNSMIKVEQAKASANESKELAVLKRRKAQSLMENADLAIYKATMLLRIAEAAKAGGESVNDMAQYFLD